MERSKENLEKIRQVSLKVDWMTCLGEIENALITMNWDVDNAILLLNEKKRLGSWFSMTKFRRSLKNGKNR